MTLDFLLVALSDGPQMPATTMSECNGETSDSASFSSSEAQSFSSTTESNHTPRDNGSSRSDDVLNKTDSKAVNRSKLLVWGVLALAAAATGTMVYIFSRKEERSDFEAKFHDFANEIVDVSHHQAKRLLGFVNSFSTEITAFALETNATWPNVTVPDFELKGASTNKLTDTIQISFVPLIKSEQRLQWEAYAAENQGWIEQSLHIAEEFFGARIDGPVESIRPNVYRYENGATGEKVLQDGPGIQFGSENYGPVWQQSPAPHDTEIVNFDLLSHPTFARAYQVMWETRLPVLSEVLPLGFLYGGAIKHEMEQPHSFFMSPVYPDFDSGPDSRDDIVGFVVAVLHWDMFFSNILPVDDNKLFLSLSNSCGDIHTYMINGPEAVYLGKGDPRGERNHELGINKDFEPFPKKSNISDTPGYCQYSLYMYPSPQLEEAYKSNMPVLYTTIVVCVFFVAAMAFLIYDWVVQRRQVRVMTRAKRTNAIVASLFPSNVRDRIIKDAEEQSKCDMKTKKGESNSSSFTDQQNFGNLFDDGSGADACAFKTSPIAELFPNTTVMFADIVGFTAWSSVREPTQVFTLLETVYHSFDVIAKRRRVFKVETVGDCYVAVTGLPDPRKHHAVAMCRFARDCLAKMNDLTKRLEVILGPDTCDLSMRFGIHSGPVTAGVLRGDKSRFQLFGDTVNTAARIESTGERNRIHISQETADLLNAAGKEHWITLREDKVTAKGKGELLTYWLDLKAQSSPSNRSGSTLTSSDEPQGSRQGSVEDLKYIEAVMEKKDNNATYAAFNDKVQRLVDWNADMLARLLKQIIARRSGLEGHGVGNPTESISPQITKAHGTGETVIDEVREIIALPEFDADAVCDQVDPDSIELPEVVVTQLRDFVTIIATMYRDNPFHNFEHASHVTMSVVKLLSRIVAPKIEVDEEKSTDGDIASTLHDHTYGITSDPLTQFACVFAALIHDVDHTGVPNAQLVKEKTHIATVYKEKSVAEQNSVDIAWDLLMDIGFNDLRNVIYSNEKEQKRFRQLVVNCVMATDIIDKDLKALRNARWDKAFADCVADDAYSRDNINRKATIVIEHLLQASDVAHTMQHFHIYRKWNERFFHEMYVAYKNGRAEKDPSCFWYQGEIGFFDFYIIPLAKKLKDCGVFGVSSDEYLNYALKNRQEWEIRGQDTVASMVEKYREQYAHINMQPEETLVRESPAEVKLDEIQEAERSPLRSKLFSSETMSEDSMDAVDVALQEEVIQAEERTHASLNSIRDQHDDKVKRMRERMARSAGNNEPERFL